MGGRKEGGREGGRMEGGLEADSHVDTAVGFDASTGLHYCIVIRSCTKHCSNIDTHIAI